MSVKGVLTIRLDAELPHQVKEQAAEECRTVTAVVDLALENYLASATTRAPRAMARK